MVTSALETTCRNDLILRAIRREKVERTPVWLMRQAGRFDPKYRRLKKNAGLELEELFRHPQLATEITLLPKRFGVDALILFQDILTPLDPMGAKFVFRPEPVLDQPVRTAAQVDSLELIEPESHLSFVGESINGVLSEAGQDLPLLGFAGAPLTLAAFMIEGTSPGRQLLHTRRLMQSDAPLMHELLERLADMTAAYLRYQAECGVAAVQLFESVGDLVSRKEYETFAHPYHSRIIHQLRGFVPSILFVKENPAVDLMVETGADVVSVGKCVDLAEVKAQFGTRVAVQGNVDNEILRSGSADEVEVEVRSCLAKGGGQGHILNLNHGVFRDTPFDNVRRLIDVVRSTSAEEIKSANGEGLES